MVFCALSQSLLKGSCEKKSKEGLFALGSVNISTLTVIHHIKVVSKHMNMRLIEAVMFPSFTAEAKN